MQPQSAQNIYVPQNAANNSTARANQPTAGNIYRQNPSSPAPRNRYVHSTAVYPTVHQNVVLGQFTAPYATRTSQLQQCQYSPQFYPPMYYPYYVQQPPQQQRASVNPGVGVGLSSAITVQPSGSVSGTTANGNQGQISLGVAPVAPSTVLGVANASSAQQVGVPPLVGIPHQPPQQQSQNVSQTKGKLRSHALPIIHPITNRNILDDLDIHKNESANVILTTPSSTSLPIVDPTVNIEIAPLATSMAISNKSSVQIPEISKPITEVVQPIEVSIHQTGSGANHSVERNFKDGTPQQTPIVSAMIDAPSVEIFPTQPQKQRAKKSLNFSNMKHEQNTSPGKTEENVKQIITTENSNCVQDSLPSNYINQQVPQRQQLRGKEQQHNISPKLHLDVQSSDDTTINKQKEDSCRVDNLGAGEQDKSTIYSFTESVKDMQLEEKDNLTIPNNKGINIVNCNEQQKPELEQPEIRISNSENGNNVIAAITLAESTDHVINSTDFINNNNNLKGNHVNKATASLKNITATSKTDDKVYNKNENMALTKTILVGKSQSVTTEISKTSSTNNNATSSEEKDHNETDETSILPEDLQNKEKIKSSSENLTANNIPSSISDKNEKTKSVSADNYEDTTSNIKKKEEDNYSKSVISYHEGQWSPSNPGGKKQYHLELLKLLCEVKASHEKTKVKNTSILAQSQNHGNKKIQPMIGAYGGTRGSNTGESNYQNYMKQSSISGRGGTDSGHYNRNSGKPIIHLNLSLNQEVKLNEANNAWRPRVLITRTDTEADSEQKAQREKEELKRRVRGILNKLTPEKFEPLVEEIIKLKIDTMDKMEAVMILVFEKAIDEPNFSVSYASLCHRLINEVKARDERMESGTKTNLASFRNALLDKTEREFTQNVTKSNAKEEKLKPIKKQISHCKDPNEKVELEALLDEEERKIRRRSGGTVRFIGELFKISILTGKIINSCIDALLKDPNNEDMLECLCKLLTTVGQKFEQTCTTKEPKQKYSLDNVIQRMQDISSKNENSKISSRVRFMLQDVIDLRKKKWQLTRNEAPKTMEQIEKEANSELSNPYHYINSMPAASVSGKREDRGGRSDGRNYGGSHSQRGDTGSVKRQQGGISGGTHSHSQSGTSNNDDTWHVQTGKGNRSLIVDSSKLVGMAVDMNNKKMGAAALFQWGSASSQQTSTPSNSFAALSLDANRCPDRDRGGPRNKGSYSKSSMERDRYDHERVISRTGSTHSSRENSSSRSAQGVRSIGCGNPSSMQKSSSHSKYQHQMSSSSFSRMTSSKITGMSSSAGGSGTLPSGLYRDSQQQPSQSASNPGEQQPFNVATYDTVQSSSAPPETFEEPTVSELKIIKSVVIEMVENAAFSKRIDNSTVSCINKIKGNLLCGFLYYILTDYLHLGNVGAIFRRHLANVVAYLIERKCISVEHFRMAYNNFAELASGLIIDIPELWLYILEFTGPLIVKKLITVNDLWNSQLRESSDCNFKQKFLKTFIQYCTREVGPSFTRTVWKENVIKWTSFMDESEVAKFIETNKFEYVEDENYQPDVSSKESKEKRNKRVVEHVQQLLEERSNADSIIDYINGNVVDVDKTFIKSLTTVLTSFAFKDSNDYSLDIPCFQKMCIPVLLRYLDSKEDLELECLYAIQLLVHSLEHPRGLLGSIFAELNDADVIPHDAFITWRDSKDQSAGKGVAVKALNPFFNQVINGETSEDN